MRETRKLCACSNRGLDLAHTCVPAPRSDAFVRFVGTQVRAPRPDLAWLEVMLPGAAA